MRTDSSIIWAAVLIILVSGTALQAQDSLGVSCLSSIGYWQSVYSMQMVDSLVFLTSGETGLRVISLSDPTHPVEIGHNRSPNRGNDWCSVYVSGPHAFISDYDGGIVLDISSPSHPVEIATWDIYGISTIQLIHDNIMIGAGDEGYPVIMDISDLNNIHVVGWYDDSPGPMTAAGMTGNYLYMLSDGIRVFDLSDPAHPVPVAAVDTTLGYGWYSAMSGDYLFWSTNSYGVRAIDISDPLQPAEAANFDPSSYGPVTLAGTHLVVAEDSLLRIWNVADPRSPFAEGVYPLQAQSYYGEMSGEGHLVCIAPGNQHPVDVIDISNPAEPRAVGSFGHTGQPHALAVNGPVCCMTDGYERLRTIGITDPHHVTEAGVADSGCYGFDVATRGNYAYVGCEIGLGVYDISNPASPVFLQCTPARPGYQLSDVTLFDHYALGIGGYSFQIFDVSNPAQPVWVDSVHTPNWYGITSGALSEDGYLYISSNAFFTYNLANPEQPVLVGTLYPVGSSFGSLAIHGNYIYAAEGEGGLVVMDRSDPAHPQDVAWLADTVYTLIVGGDKLIATGALGIDVYDLANPLAPVKAGYYHTGERITGMALGAPYLYTCSSGEFCSYEVDAFLNVPTQDIQPPHEFALHQAFPNPFNPATTLSFSLPCTERTTLTAYDVTGRQVQSLVNEVMSAGEHRVLFSGTALASGVYFVRLEAGSKAQTQKLFLLK